MHKFLNAFIALAFFLLISEVAGVIGSFVTIPALPGWYDHLILPTFSPPHFIFGQLWMALYFMTGLGAFFVYRKGKNIHRYAHYKQKDVKIGMILFGVQLALNVLWSFIFFGWHLPVLALVEIVILWLVIALTIRHFFKVSETGAFLLIPYFLWVTYAVLLNCAIVVLN